MSSHSERDQRLPSWEDRALLAEAEAEVGIAQWMAERCRLARDAGELEDVLYGSYARWCRDRAKPTAARRTFARLLDEAGYGLQRSAGMPLRRGIGLARWSSSDEGCARDRPA